MPAHVLARSNKLTARKDPPPRPTDGWHSVHHMLKGREPDFKYVWVSEENSLLGPDYYESIGYTVVRYTATGGVSLGSLTRKPGEPIRFRGNVLMRCTKLREEQIAYYGPDGDTGEELAGRIIRQINDRNHVPHEVTKGLSGGIAVDRDLKNDLNPAEKV